MVRPILLFYCQPALGSGHLMRSLALVAKLALRFRVVFLSGGPLPRGFRRPRGIQMVALPPLGMAADGALVSHDRRRTVERAQALRQKLIMRYFHLLRPEVLLIDLFPFARKSFASELLPLLLEAKHAPTRPVVLCSLWDLLSRQGDDRPHHDEQASTLANQYFDAVLVHTDPAFACLEESFRPRTPLRVPVHYTGFVVPEATPTVTPRAPQLGQLLVSAAVGHEGEALLHMAIEAHTRLWPSTGLTMKVVAEPALAAGVWQSLRTAARGRQGLLLKRSATTIPDEMWGATASVSQCDYHTAMSILQTGVPALVVPTTTEREESQLRRARRLEQFGAVRLLKASPVNASDLAEAIRDLLRSQTSRTSLQINGARHTAQLVENFVDTHRFDLDSPLSAHRSAASRLATV